MMQTVQIDADTFYAERDNRTNLLLAQPSEPVRLALSVSPAWAATGDGQLALLWLCSLVSRMGRRFNRLRLWLPGDAQNTPCLIPGAAGRTLAEALVTHLRGADPFGLYGIVERLEEDDFVISVGDLAEEAPGLIVRPEGWAAGIMSAGGGQHPYDPPGDLNPVGAALAAAMGAAAVYQYFNAELVPDYEIRVPLWVSALRSAVTESADVAAGWTGDPGLPQAVDLGRCLVVGAGALGGNALAILGALGARLSGKVDVAEFDLLEISNLNRLVAALFQHVGLPKAHIASHSLRETGVKVNSLVAPYERLRQSAAPSRLEVEQYEAVVTGVDQMATRAFVQSDWPRLLINAGTGGFTWRVSTHPADTEGACMGCVAGNGQQSYRGMREPVPCAVGQPTRPGQPPPPADSYGFVSFFGAAFLAARMLQRASGLLPDSRESFVTGAVALNLAGLRHEAARHSDKCLCRCRHEAVRDYRVAKYSGVAC